MSALIPAPGDAPPMCHLCLAVGEIVNEQPADGGRAVWARWTVRPMLVWWAEPEQRGEVSRSVVRCVDHPGCRARVHANGDRWDILDRCTGPADPLPQPELVPAGADDDPLWGAS